MISYCTITYLSEGVLGVYPEEAPVDPRREYAGRPG